MIETLARTRFVSHAGLAYEDRGDGRPVVLVHGWCLSGRMWTYLAERLAHGHRVVVPDLPGFGASAGLEGSSDLDVYGDQLAALLEELDLQDAVVVGFAFGAAVGMSAAARHPARLGGLVSIGVPSAAHAAYDRMPRAIRRDWPEFSRRSAAAICAREHSAATLAWLAEMFAATPIHVALATVELLARFEPAELAPSVRVPALLVHGAEDAIVPVGVSQACADALAEARLKVVEGSGHLVVLDDKERLADIVSDFLE